MTIKDIRGLKYPDEYIIKYFFKKGFDKRSAKVLEFGSGTGNNLSLFYQYDWDVVGVDMVQSLNDDASYNFTNIYESKGESIFHTSDMSTFVKNNHNIKADVFMLPGVISYIDKEAFVEFLELANKFNAFKEGADFFIRTRSKKDYRYGLGKDMGNDSFLMQNNITGEEGALCTCYDEYELVLLLQKYLKLRDFDVFSLENQNDQKHKVLNADIVIWGRIG